MDKKEAERIVKNIELIKAFANGATIQRAERCVEPKRWVDTPSPLWDGDFEYRVKPEPEELFITVQGDQTCKALANGADGRRDCFVGGVYTDLDAATRHVGDWPAPRLPSRIFKVIEVMS